MLQSHSRCCCCLVLGTSPGRGLSVLPCVKRRRRLRPGGGSSRSKLRSSGDDLSITNHGTLERRGSLLRRHSCQRVYSTAGGRSKLVSPQNVPAKLSSFQTTRATRRLCRPLSPIFQMRSSVRSAPSDYNSKFRRCRSCGIF